MRLFSVGNMVAGLALLLGGAGIDGFYVPMLKPLASESIAKGVGLVPVECLWLITFTFYFTNQPLIFLRTYRHGLQIAMFWYAAVVIFAEAMLLFGYVPDDETWHIWGRVLMHAGWIGFIPMIRVCRFARRHEPGGDLHLAKIG